MPQPSNKPRKWEEPASFSRRPAGNNRSQDAPYDAPATQLPPAKEKFTARKRRCDNCPKYFTQTQEHQRFHSDSCRKEFWRNGAAFGPLREKLPKFIAKEVAKQLEEIKTAILQLDLVVARLGSRVNDIDERVRDLEYPADPLS